MSVNRAFAIVRAVANSIGPVSPTEIAKQIGVPRASVYRLIKTLEDERVLRHSKDRSRVELTAGFLRNMLAGASTDQIIAGFEETLSCTANNWGATAFLGRLNGTSVEEVHSVAPCDSRMGHVHPGLNKRPAHACSASRAILAFLPADRAAALLGDEHERFTERTLTDKDALAYELAETRARGFAVCDEEIDPGITSVAAPVIIGRAGVVFSLGIVTFTRRMHEHGIKAVGDYLHAKAKGAVLNASQNLFEFTT